MKRQVLVDFVYEFTKQGEEVSLEVIGLVWEIQINESYKNHDRGSRVHIIALDKTKTHYTIKLNFKRVVIPPSRVLSLSLQLHPS